MTPIVLECPFKTTEGEQQAFEIRVAGRVVIALPGVSYAEISRKEARQLALDLLKALGENDPESN